MRDEFSPSTKRKLAERVAYRCCFPGCDRITVGPESLDTTKSRVLGNAAHISAASRLGPRHDEALTPLERSHIDNGIWMCAHHADYIDKDEREYSAATLRDWKREAERRAYVALKDFDRELPRRSATLVAIGEGVVLEGFWREVKDHQWTFEIDTYIVGNEDALRAFDGEVVIPTYRYIVVESQGDGRLLKGPIIWRMTEGRSELVVQVEPPTPRTTPYHLSDLSNPLDIANGDFKLVKGEDCAKQIIANTLSTSPGELFFDPGFGSYASKYYWLFKGHIELLQRMLKLEVTRLLALPTGNEKEGPALSFIKRVLDVRVADIGLHDDMLGLQIRLEWGDGKPWIGDFSVFIHSQEKSRLKNVLLDPDN